MKRTQKLTALLLALGLLFALCACQASDRREEEQAVQTESAGEAAMAEEPALSPESAAADEAAEGAESPEAVVSTAEEAAPEASDEANDNVEITVPEGMEIGEE